VEACMKGDDYAGSNPEHRNDNIFVLRMRCISATAIPFEGHYTLRENFVLFDG
jgi:hypothetical protein